MYFYIVQECQCTSKCPGYAGKFPISEKTREKKNKIITDLSFVMFIFVFLYSFNLEGTFPLSKVILSDTVPLRAD